MKLTEATTYAEKIAEWLAPHCEFIEIAGSVRRRRPNPNDVDLVVIPKHRTVKDMLGAVIEDTLPLIAHLNEYVASQARKDRAENPSIGYRMPGDHGAGGELRKVSQESLPSGPRENILIKLKSCDLDIFLATEETLGSVLLCRTGSVQHNIYLAERARAHGSQWKTQTGIWRDGELIASRTEHAIFAALKLDWLEPEKRERK